MAVVYKIVRKTMKKAPNKDTYIETSEKLFSEGSEINEKSADTADASREIDDLIAEISAMESSSAEGLESENAGSSPSDEVDLSKDEMDKLLFGNFSDELSEENTADTSATDVSDTDEESDAEVDVSDISSGDTDIEADEDILKADTKEYPAVKHTEEVPEKSFDEYLREKEESKISEEKAEPAKAEADTVSIEDEEDLPVEENTDAAQTQKISRARGVSMDSYIGTDEKTRKMMDTFAEEIHDAYSTHSNKPSDGGTSEGKNNSADGDNKVTSEADKILESVFGTPDKKEKKKKEKEKKKKKKEKEEKHKDKKHKDKKHHSSDSSDEAEIDIEKILAEEFNEDSSDDEEKISAIADASENEASSSDAAESVSDNDEPSVVSEEKDMADDESDEAANDDDFDEDDEDEDEKIDDNEYTSPEQSQEFFTELKNAGAKNFGSLIWTAVITLLLFYLESACFTDIYHPLILQPGKFGIVFLLVDLQLLFISGILVLSNLVNGAKALFTGRANLNSVTFVVMLTSALHVLINLFTNASSDEIMLFSTVASFSAMVNAFCSLINTKRNYNSFKVVANKKQKLVAKRLSSDSDTAKAFSEYLPEGPDIFSVERSDFVDGFMKNTKAYAPSDAVFRISIPICIIASLALAVFAYFSEGTFISAVNVFSLTVFMSLPLSSMFVISLPFFVFSKKANKMESAIIGEKAIDDYCNTAAVSFNDLEVFPAKGVKITIVRAYGSNRIDRIMLYAAKIFNKVGGPLSSVFENSVSGMNETEFSDAEILEIAKNGICASLDGKEIFVGTKDYMFDYEFGYVKDQIDQAFEKSVGRIMYMAIDDEIAAKFYIKYSISHSFENILKQMAQVGICASIRSCDPNIDTALLTTLLKKKNYPAIVLKTHEAARSAAPLERAESGIVCTSTTANMLKTFILTDKIKQRISANTLVKFISLLLGIFTVAFLYITGCADRANTLYVLIYQILWMLPVIIPSYVD